MRRVEAQRALLLSLLVLATLSGCAQPDSFKVWVQTDAQGVLTQAEAKARGISLHPCGAAKEIRVSNISADRVEGANTVVELNSNGAVLARWATPIDVMPVAVDGSWLYVTTGTAVLGISTDGRLKARGDLSRETAHHESCQQPLDRYRQQNGIADGCWVIGDLNSGNPRNIAFPFVCT